MAEPISGNIYTKEIPSYCPRCMDVWGVQARLIPRQYKEDDPALIAGELPYDHNQWKQCYHCGTLVPIHDIPKEGQLTTDIERITSKFQTQKGLPEHYDKPKHKRGFNERLEKAELEIKDKELKAELKKGAKLISYSER